MFLDCFYCIFLKNFLLSHVILGAHNRVYVTFEPDLSLDFVPFRYHGVIYGSGVILLVSALEPFVVCLVSVEIVSCYV